jgi:succinylglutamate desuccinylase
VRLERLEIDGGWLLTSEEPGDNEAVAIFGGIHPDEPAGIEVVNDIRGLAEAGTFRLDRGTVFLLLGNLAVMSSQEGGGQHAPHFRDYNLNRCHIADDDPNAHLLPSPETYEYQRSRQLMSFLDQSQAALDLHTHYEEGVSEFIITEQATGLALARRIGAPAILFGVAHTEPGGTDYYMHRRGRTGLCHELGYNGPEHRQKAVDIGHASVARFLTGQGLREDDGTLPPLQRDPSFFEAEQVFKRSEDPDDFVSGKLVTFGELEAGQLLGRCQGQAIIARAGQVPVFPDPSAQPGSEMLSLARRVSAS